MLSNDTLNWKVNLTDFKLSMGLSALTPEQRHSFSAEVTSLSATVADSGLPSMYTVIAKVFSDNLEFGISKLWTNNSRLVRNAIGRSISVANVLDRQDHRPATFKSAEFAKKVPNGWKTIGDLKDRDLVLESLGKVNTNFRALVSFYVWGNVYWQDAISKLRDRVPPRLEAGKIYKAIDISALPVRPALDFMYG